MKTKIILSIAMLVISMMGYASDEETTIPIEKMRYAMNHPGTPVIVDSVTFLTLSDNYLWLTTNIDYKVIMYEEGEPLNEFGQSGSSTTIFNWMMLVWIILYSFFVIFGSYLKNKGSLICGGLLFLVAVVFHSDMIPNPLHILQICLILALCIGYLAREINKKTKLKNKISGK